ncbi:MAG TPA: DNA circularization N-terminal domain-containing protein [Bradyrhizobium sp.]
MSNIFDFASPWRSRLLPGSFNGVQFHVDVGARSSGRRIALHEFPKRDTPYAEDMGRRARRFSVTCYVLGPDYTFNRDALIEQFEQEGPGLLVHPTFGEQLVAVDQYSITERRERGGVADFEITFVEAGSNAFLGAFTDTQSTVAQAADDAKTAAKDSAKTNLEMMPSDI